MPAKQLIVMRHAKSSWRTSEPDFRRPLSERGTKDAVVAGEVLAEYRIELVISSAATRARQTWQSAEMGGARSQDVRFTEDFYHAWGRDILAALNRLDDSVRVVMVLGHEPTMSEVIQILAEPSALLDEIEYKFPTAAIAVLSFEGSWAALKDGTATLQRVEIPRG